MADLGEKDGRKVKDMIQTLNIPMGSEFVGTVSSVRHNEIVLKINKQYRFVLPDNLTIPFELLPSMKIGILCDYHGNLRFRHIDSGGES